MKTILVSLALLCSALNATPLDDVVNALMMSDHGLGDVAKLRGHLAAIAETEREAELMKVVDAARDRARARVAELSTTYKLSEKTIDQALSSASDSLDGRKPNGFIQAFAKALKAKAPKMKMDDAVALARGAKILFDSNFALANRTHFADGVLERKPLLMPVKIDGDGAPAKAGR